MAISSHEDLKLTIIKVGNGYIFHNGDKSFVCEDGNEIDMIYAIQKFFGFVAVLPPEGEIIKPIDAGDVDLDV